jgi:integral membrane protein
MGSSCPSRYAPTIDQTAPATIQGMRQRSRARRAAASHNVRSIRFLRWMAVAEASAFLVLITFGVLKHFYGSWWQGPLFVMGNLHGAIFTTYLVSIFVFRRRVGWGPVMLLLVLLAGLTPGGGLMVERWALHPPTNR